MSPDQRREVCFECGECREIEWCKIVPGEYLTMDYETTEEELFREFTCCCGSDKCRGLIQGSPSKVGKVP